jgi:hypothetical protein
MSRTEFSSKFKKSMSVFQLAVEGQMDLDMQHPKVYKKLIKFYQEQGVEFYDDLTDDYELVLDCLREDLRNCGVTV